MVSTSTAQAQPLKVTPTTPAKNINENETADKTPLARKGATTPKPSVGVNNISSPHELTAFVCAFFVNPRRNLIKQQVETLLEQLDTKFDEMSSQILDRMNQMSTRVDALETSIQDIINGDLSVPQSPSPIPGTPGGMR